MTQIRLTDPHMTTATVRHVERRDELVDQTQTGHVMMGQQVFKSVLKHILFFCLCWTSWGLLGLWGLDNRSIAFDGVSDVTPAFSVRTQHGEGHHSGGHKLQRVRSGSQTQGVSQRVHPGGALW